MNKKITINSGSWTRCVDLPDGFSEVNDGFIQQGDRTFTMCGNVFEEVSTIEIGRNVSDFICVIRKDSPASLQCFKDSPASLQGFREWIEDQEAHFEELIRFDCNCPACTDAKQNRDAMSDILEKIDEFEHIKA